MGEQEEFEPLRTNALSLGNTGIASPSGPSMSGDTPVHQKQPLLLDGIKPRASKVSFDLPRSTTWPGEDNGSEGFFSAELSDAAATGTDAEDLTVSVEGVNSSDADAAAPSHWHRVRRAREPPGDSEMHRRWLRVTTTGNAVGSFLKPDSENCTDPLQKLSREHHPEKFFFE